MTESQLIRAEQIHAKQGEYYSVKDGDRLWMIALVCYGDRYRYGDIVSANPQLNGRKPASDGSPVIYQGDRIFIPVDKSELPDGSQSFAIQQASSFSVIVDGEPIAVTTGEFYEAFDTGCDMVTFTVDPESLSRNVSDKLKPFRYTPVKLTMNGILRFTGRVYDVDSKCDSSKWEKTVTCYSLTADFCDSVVNPPLEQKNISLKARATQLVKEWGLSVTVEGSDKQFPKVVAEPEQKRFDHIKKLAHDRKLVVTCNERGNLVLCKPKTSGKPVAVIEQGGTIATSFSLKTEGRKRFSHYRIAGKTKTEKSITGEKTKHSATRTIVDKNMPINRYFARKDGSTDTDDLSDRAEFERSKAIADALTFSVPVSTWKDATGNHWKANTFVTLKSKALDIENGVDLLIRRVKFNIDPDQGETATLELCPYQVFTGDDVPDIFA